MPNRARLSIVILCLLLAGCAKPAEAPSQNLSLFIMDSFVEIKAVGAAEITGPALQAAVAAVKHVDKLLGYQNSAVTELNRKHSLNDPEIYRLIKLGLEIEGLTGGAFSWSLRPILDSYGFTGLHAYRLPTAAEFAAWRQLPDDRGIRLDSNGRTISTAPSLRLELASLGDGYAADLAAAALRRSGVKDGLVNASGEVVGFGERTWQIAIRHPRGSGYLTILPIKNRCVSTSGDYERFFMVGKRRYCHILDPQTGISPERYISVTVVADNCAAADAWSTALFVCDIDKLKPELERRGIDWLIVTRTGRILKSPGLEADLPRRLNF